MGFDAKSFLAFFILVSEKLDTKLSDNLLKKALFWGDFSCECRGENGFKAIPIPLRKYNKT
ncbi:hypothetical protein Taitung32_01670 [Helicobacter pylori]